MEIRSFAERDVPAMLRCQVRTLRRQAWPADDRVEDGDAVAEDEGHDPALHPLSMLLIDDGVVLAALDILSKEISHRGHRYAASGLSTVVVDRGKRRSGYGRQLVSIARDRIADSGADLGIFTCDRPLQRFYEAAGWSTLLGTVLIGSISDAPFPSDQFDTLTMGAFFSATAMQAADTFKHCRIELYPGLRDKLW